MKISCLILAAGQSSRMRGPNKLLLPIDGQEMISRTVSEILKSTLHEVILVTGHEQDKISQATAHLNVKTIYNDDHKTGMHSSIRAGLKHLAPCDAFFICLADLPAFDYQILNELIRSMGLQPESKIFLPTYEDRNGHPVLLSSIFRDEILQMKDGDYGCSYLIKRHPDLVRKLPVTSPGILLDIDEPTDYDHYLNNSYLPTDPVEEFHKQLNKQRLSAKPFVVATVIEVMGSASARVGSKAIFNQAGLNILGWVGGGCAERFIGEEAVSAIAEKVPRIVLADLDDEIFGLGVACGGKMRVFIDPILPAETFSLPHMPELRNEIRILTGFYGWNVQREHQENIPTNVEDLMLLMSLTASKKRGVTHQPLKDIKKVPATFLPHTRKYKKSVAIVGRTRITEALARHFNLLSYQVRVIGPGLKAEDYPETVKCSCLEDSYAEIDFNEGEVVIVASHTAQDPAIVSRALKQKASHVAMIGSYKRSVEVLTHLNLLEQTTDEPLYVPAGLDMDARNPDEIALSVVAEVIIESRKQR